MSDVRAHEMETRTPPVVDKYVKRLIAKVAPGQDPIRLRVTPAENAILGECFGNVAARVAANGGELVYGWQIWTWPHVLVEAEFHAVWRSSSGDLRDITPKHGGDREILFVPDPRRVYKGVPIDNVRIAIRDDLVVRDFIEAAEKMTRLRVESGRDTGDGHISLPAREAEPLMEVQAVAEQMLTRGLRASDPCACGSSRKYKRCHGKVLRR